CASAALPPFPQKYRVPPPRTVSRTNASARSREGPSCSTTRCAVAASSPRGPANASDTPSETSKKVGAALDECFEPRRITGVTGVLECVRGQRIDSEEIESAVSREALFRQESIEGTGRSTKTNVRGARFRRLRVAAERRERL